MSGKQNQANERIIELNINEQIVSVMASFKLQIERLQEMKSILDGFSTMLVVRMDAVEGMLDDLKRISFPEEIAEKYRYRYLYDDKAIVEDLANNLRTEQFDYIDNKIRIFKEMDDIN